ELALRGQRPLGVVLPFGDEIAGLLGQHGVVQQEAVHGQKRRHLAGRVGRQIAHHVLQVVARCAQRLDQAPAFARHVVRLYAVVGHLEGGRPHHRRPPDRVAFDHALPAHAEGGVQGSGRIFGGGHEAILEGGYSCSPNLLANKACISARARSASGTSSSMVTVTPRPAASIMTPMMLLALTRLSLRAMKISQLAKLEASWVSFAAARACRPNLLLMAISTAGMFVLLEVFV